MLDVIFIGLIWISGAMGVAGVALAFFMMMEELLG